MRSLSVYGGTNMRRQRDQLAEGPQVVVGTPGRVMDLIRKGWLDLTHVKHFVLDEVDRMLDMGFIDDIETLWSWLQPGTQILAFSATIPPELQAIVTKFLGEDYVYIRATPESIRVERIDDSFILVEKADKLQAIEHILSREQGKRVIIFTRTKTETGKLAKDLDLLGYTAAALHGDMEQRERMRALKSFQTDEVKILVATDVASRGLNVKNIELVINYHVPEDPESYIHRIGRTGRNGAEGRAVMLVDHSEEPLFRAVERKNKISVKQIDMDGNPIERTRDGFGSDASARNARGASSGGGRHRSRGRRRGHYRGGSRERTRE